MFCWSPPINFRLFVARMLNSTSRKCNKRICRYGAHRFKVYMKSTANTGSIVCALIEFTDDVCNFDLHYDALDASKLLPKIVAVATLSSIPRVVLLYPLLSRYDNSEVFLPTLQNDNSTQGPPGRVYALPRSKLSGISSSWSTSSLTNKAKQDSH